MRGHPDLTFYYPELVGVAAVILVDSAVLIARHRAILLHPAHPAYLLLLLLHSLLKPEALPNLLHFNFYSNPLAS